MTILIIVNDTNISFNIFLIDFGYKIPISTENFQKKKYKMFYKKIAENSNVSF